jgi:predicted RNA-binding Zn ribbon-like protein
MHSDAAWRDPDPVAGLARRVIEELARTDPSRFRQCQRKEFDLLFFDTTRSRSQRWHVETAAAGWRANADGETTTEVRHRRRLLPALFD